MCCLNSCRCSPDNHAGNVSESNPVHVKVPAQSPGTGLFEGRRRATTARRKCCHGRRRPPWATLKTNRGDIVLNLFPNHAPTTVQNFVGLAEGTKEWTDPTSGQKSTERFYDGLVFHRVIDGFMIQGGCPIGDGRGGPGYQFKDEFHLELSFFKPYLLAMANAGPGPTARSSSSPSRRPRT